jgi:hypothetical protein
LLYAREDEGGSKVTAKQSPLRVWMKPDSLLAELVMKPGNREVD